MKTEKIKTFNDSMLIILALISVGLLLFELRADVSEETITLIRTIDLGIALIFGLEFIIRLSQAHHKNQFIKQNWWQLLASIPITGSGTQILRGFMLVRVFRVLRITSILARYNIVSASFRRAIGKTHMGWVGSLLVIGMTLGTSFFYYFEQAVNPYVNNLFDSFWFIAETMTNTGIGEVYPLTVGGRLIGILAMFFGAILFGLFVAFIASYLVESRAKK